MWLRLCETEIVFTASRYWQFGMMQPKVELHQGPSRTHIATTQTSITWPRAANNTRQAGSHVCASNEMLYKSSQRQQKRVPQPQIKCQNAKYQVQWYCCKYSVRGRWQSHKISPTVEDAVRGTRV
jgi:hypothetical protein